MVLKEAESPGFLAKTWPPSTAEYLALVSVLGGNHSQSGSVIKINDRFLDGGLLRRGQTE